MKTDPFSEQRQNTFMQPIVEAWLEKVTRAREAKKNFQNVAEQCDGFFRKDSGFMWKDKFKKKFLGSVDTPKFQVTIAKAFELVALFGPTLFWKYPGRNCRTHKPLEFGPEITASLMGTDLQDPAMQEMVQQQHQRLMQQMQVDESKKELRCQLMEKYLNYSQREQPSGLAKHAERAITEALVKGRGVLWVMDHQFPGSQRNLTGCFYKTVDDLFIDPDCEDPLLETAGWIVLRHCEPTDKVEDRFGLERGSLPGSLESGNSQAVLSRPRDVTMRKEGKTKDLTVWYEIWSKIGVGARLQHKGSRIVPNVDEDIADQFDEEVGDYAYLCVAQGVNYALNAPSQRIAQAETPEQVAELFQWRCAKYGKPFPTYADDRWPCAFLDFYPVHDSPWPMAPLQPGLGELICLNILTSAFIEQAYDNRKSIIGAKASVSKILQDALYGSKSPVVVEIPDAATDMRISDIIEYLNKPSMNMDIIKAIEYVSMLFDKRTGLSEIMYAMNAGAASRSARDVAVKEEKASIRPDKMAKDVAQWMTDCAMLEKFLAYWILTGEDIRPLMGNIGAMLWDQLISSEDPEVVLREMTATVEANEHRKPNKEREAANIQQMSQFLLPMLDNHASATGDTGPLNAFLDSFGDAIEQDTSKWTMQPRTPPPPPPEQQQAMEMQQQTEMAKLQAEMQGEQLNVELKKLDAMIKQMELQSSGIEGQQKQMEFQFDVQSRQLDQQLDAQKRQQDMQFDLLKNRTSLQFDQERHRQDIMHDAQKHAQEIGQDRSQHLLDMVQQREMGEVKTDAMERQAKIKEKAARARPSTNGTKK